MMMMMMTFLAYSVKINGRKSSKNNSMKSSLKTTHHCVLWLK